MDASLVFDIDASQARGAAKALAELNSAAIKTANSASKFERTLRASNGQFRSTTGYLAEHKAEVESLAKSYNPALAAQIRYREESIRTGAAVKAGVITEQQRIEILGRTKAALDASANAAQRFGQSQEVARHHVANLSFQLNDIGMMMAMGQNPFMLMVQQGPQVAQIFSQLNQEGRKLGPTLAGAFKMFLNPVTAVTLAVVGGAAALGQWGISALGATQNTDGFINSLDGLTSSANSYATALRTADQNSFALTAQFGAQADSLQRLYDINVRLERIKLGQSIREASEQSLTQFRGLGDQLERINRLSGYAVEDIDGMGTATQMLNTEVERLYDSYGLGVAQANELNSIMEQMARSRSIEDQAEAAERFAQLLTDAHEAGATIPPELIEIAYRAGVAAISIREMAAASNDAAAAWNRVGTNTGTFIDSYEGPPPGPRPGRGGGGGRGGGSSRGGGSAIKSIEDEMKRRWETLNSGFQSEYQLSMQHYQRDLETLKWALDQKAITQQEYEANRMMLYTTAWGAEWQQTQLQRQMDIEALQSALDQKLILEEEYYRKRKEMYWANLLNEDSRSDMAQDLSNTAQYFGQLTALTGNSYDTLARLQKSFAASAALVNAYLAASQTLADPTLGFWAKMAAYGKVLAAGLGLVSAIKGGGRGASSGAATTTQQAQREPTRYVTINWDGPDWMRDGINGLLDEIYQQSKDGRVIIAEGAR